MKRLLIALAGLALVLAGCSSDNKGTAAPPVSLGGTTNNHGTKAASGSMEVELDDFYFGPTFITAKAGQQVTFELKNDAKQAHTFTSTALGNIDEELAPGASKKVTVTVPQSGTALFFCRFHQGQGMQGAVVVK